MKNVITICTAFVLLSAGGCSKESWRDTFDVDKANLGPSGDNAYFLLTPGYGHVYADGNDTVKSVVLDETFIVDGVTTRVIVDSEWIDGDLEEVTRDYFAADTTTGDVYYFGEDVNIYQADTVVGHEGAWLSGIGEARFGLMMPGEGRLEVGDRFYQEVAPDVAMDRAELISVTDTIQTQVGAYRDCVHFEESSALESGTSDKWYAADVGLIRDDDFLLTEIISPYDTSRTK